MGKKKRKRKPVWIRCIVCNEYFNREGTRALHCGDKVCKEEAPKIQAKKKYMDRKDRIIHLLKEGCFFSGYLCCNGKLNLHCEDGTYWFQISGWKQSSIYSMTDEDFEIALKKKKVVLCERHFNMVRKIQSEGGSWDEAILYVMDNENPESQKESEMEINPNLNVVKEL